MLGISVIVINDTNQAFYDDPVEADRKYWAWRHWTQDLFLWPVWLQLDIIEWWRGIYVDNFLYFKK